MSVLLQLKKVRTEIAYHKAILEKPESTSSHATTYHCRRKVQLFNCMLIMYFYIHVAYVFYVALLSANGCAI